MRWHRVRRPADPTTATRSDQWLYVVAGVGTGLVAGREVALRPGTFLLIEAGEAHELTNTGTDILQTLNLYAPPVY